MSRNWIFLIAMTLVTVVIWIGVEVSLNIFGDKGPDDYSSYLIPLQSSFDQKAIDEILSREEDSLIVDRDVLE